MYLYPIVGNLVLKKNGKHGIQLLCFFLSSANDVTQGMLHLCHTPHIQGFGMIRHAYGYTLTKSPCCPQPKQKDLKQKHGALALKARRTSDLASSCTFWYHFQICSLTTPSRQRHIFSGECTAVLKRKIPRDSWSASIHHWQIRTTKSPKPKHMLNLACSQHPVTRIDLHLPMVKLSLGEVTSQFWCSLAFAHCKLLLSHGWRRGGMGKDNMLRGRVIIANQVQVLNSPPSSFSRLSAILKICNYIKKSTLMTCELYFKALRTLRTLKPSREGPKVVNRPKHPKPVGPPARNIPAPTGEPGGWSVEDSRLNNLWNYRNLKPNKLCVCPKMFPL